MKKTFLQTIIEQLEEMELEDHFVCKDFIKNLWGDYDYFIARSFSVIFANAKKKFPLRKYKSIQGKIYRIE